MGMTIDYTKTGKVMFKMQDYVEALLAECPKDLMKGPSVTPAANHLFEVNPNAIKLSPIDSDMYHHLVAKLLYLGKRTRPDILLAVCFLTTRVSQPDEDDWKKLGRCLQYLEETKTLYLTLEADNLSNIKWWIDASFAVHKDMKSHTGAVTSLGKGAIYAMSNKQQINTQSSTEAELVGVNDAIGMALWIRQFMEEQGYDVTDNVIYQDNQSAMLLERNGHKSSGKKTRHLDIRYYFITDQIGQEKIRVQYCPTDEMVADFFTKPLQGSKFRQFCDAILNVPQVMKSVMTELVHVIAPVAGQECVGTSERIGASVRPSDPDDREQGWTVVRKRSKSVRKRNRQRTTRTNLTSFA